MRKVKNRKKDIKKLIIYSILAVALGIGVYVVYTNNFDNRSGASGQYLDIPQSTIKPYNAGKWSFKVYDTNAKPSDWNGQTEDKVFWKRLEHTQGDKSWTIKLGKGGQLFSIKAAGVGEMIPNQRTWSGYWVDEVYQHTIPSTISKSTDYYFYYFY